MTLLGSQVPESLVLEIREYLAVREGSVGPLSSASANPARLVVPVSEWKRKKEAPTEPLGLGMGKGWFKDEYELSLQSRSDISAPLVVHPLSYLELEKYGYGRLSDGIVEHGGPYEVGRLISLDWAEPVLELEPEDPRFRPVRTETFSLDMSGALSLGSGLEDRLSAAEALDMAVLKEAVARRGQLQGPGTSRIRRENDGPNYSSSSSGSSSSSSSSSSSTSGSMQAPQSASQERFSLDTNQRVFLVLVLASFSVAHGRATNDIVDSEALKSTMAVFSLALGYTSLFSSVACAYLSRTSQRSPLLWGIMGALGGPSVVRDLRRRRDLIHTNLTK